MTAEQVALLDKAKQKAEAALFALAAQGKASSSEAFEFAAIAEIIIHVLGNPEQ